MHSPGVRRGTRSPQDAWRLRSRRRPPRQSFDTCRSTNRAERRVGPTRPHFLSVIEVFKDCASRLDPHRGDGFPPTSKGRPRFCTKLALMAIRSPGFMRRTVQKIGRHIRFPRSLQRENAASDRRFHSTPHQQTSRPLHPLPPLLRRAPVSSPRPSPGPGRFASRTLT